MTVLTQGMQPLEFLISEATSSRSRDQFVATVAGSVALPSGTVVGKIAVSGKVIKYVDGAADGSQTAIGVLGTPLPGVNGDYKALVFTRDCEVIGAKLNGGVALDANGQADLKALGIIIR